MSFHQVRIASREHGGFDVEIDGHAIQDSLCHLELDALTLQPVLTLRMTTVSIGVGLPARVRLDEDTVAALQAMGWTPPEDAP